MNKFINTFLNDTGIDKDNIWPSGHSWKHKLKDFQLRILNSTNAKVSDSVV